MCYDVKKHRNQMFQLLNGGGGLRYDGIRYLTMIGAVCSIKTLHGDENP